MKLLRNGYTRNVLLVGRWAVKVPTFKTWGLFLYGILSNMQEVQFGKLGWPELCPVVWAAPLGLVVVMRRARPLTDEEWASFQSLFFGEWWGRHAGRIDGIVERDKRCSWGIVGGRTVAVDYGARGPELQVEMDVSVVGSKA